MASAARLKKWIISLVILFMGFSVYVGTCRWKPELKVPSLDGSTVMVLPGIHLIGGIGPAAAYVVETSDGLVIIDTGLSADAKELKAAMKTQGLDWMQLRSIFLTHVHGDHCGGADRLRAETGAQVYAGQADVPVLEVGGPRDAFFSHFKMPGHVPHSTTVDVALQGGETITVGECHFEVLETPGHTTGSTCYLLERSGARVLFSGDVIYRLGEKPLGTYSTYLAPRYRGDAYAYLTTLQKLQNLPAPDLVLPGHPSASRGLQSPRITPLQWDEMLDRGIAEMKQLVARIESDGAGFLDGIPKRLLPDLYYLGDYHDNPVYVFFAESRMFTVNAPGGRGLIDFIQSKTRELGLDPTRPFAVLLTDCGEAETAGLRELTEFENTSVVVATDGVDVIKKLCPDHTVVIPADDLKLKGWFPVTTVPLGGRGVAPIAYLLNRTGKTVLFSGRIPMVIDRESGDVLAAELSRSGSDAQKYSGTMQVLARLQPDLWLPTITTDAQNANLYDGEWRAILEKNHRIANEIPRKRSFSNDSK